MKLFFIVVMLAGCAVIPPDTKVFQTVSKNFTYKKEPEGVDRWLKFTNINKKFTGDCEDMAFMVQDHIGGTVKHVTLDGEPHAALFKGKWVFDRAFNKWWPTPVDDYPGVINFEMNFEKQGIVINN